MSLGSEAYRVGTAADDRQVLVAPRFNITWSPKAVEAGGEASVQAFQEAFCGMLSYLTVENDPNAHGPADRTEALLAFATLMNIDGSTVTYGERNTRYTNMGGIVLAEAIEPDLPMDGVEPQGGIPNPLNYPELQSKPAY